MGLPVSKIDLASYLVWEHEQPTRNEFYQGEIFAMVGSRRVHGIVAGNVFAALKNQLKGSGCRAFIEDQKVQVAQDMVFYPDVFVTCNKQDLETDYIFTAPSLVIEVLSTSTQA